MRLHKIIMFAIIALTSIFLICTNPIHFSRIDNLIEFNPLKADSLLNNSRSLILPSYKSKFYTQKTRIHNKLGISDEEDTLIHYATRYYGLKRKNCNSALAWYSQGYMYSLLSNQHEAIRSLLYAEYLFPDDNSIHYAFTEYMLGYNLLNQTLAEDAISYFKKSIDCSTRLGYESLKNKALLHLAECHLILKNHSEAFNIINQVDYKYLSTSHLIDNYETMKAYIEFYNNKKVETIFTNGNTKLTGDIYYSKELYDSAFFYYDYTSEKSKDLNTLLECYKRLTQLRLTGVGNNSKDYFSLYLNISDSINKIKSSCINILNETKNTIAIAEATNKGRYSRTLVIIIMITVLILTAIFVVKQENIYRIKDNITKSEVQIISNKMARQDNHSENKENLIELYKAELRDCTSLFIKEGKGASLMSKAAIRDIDMSNNDKDLLFQSLNYYFRPILQVLFDEIPNISNEEAYVCILSLLGLDSVDISILMNVSDSCIRHRRKRVRDKDVSNIIASLSNTHMHT